MSADEIHVEHRLRAILSFAKSASDSLFVIDEVGDCLYRRAVSAGDADPDVEVYGYDITRGTIDALRALRSITNEAKAMLESVQSNAKVKG